MWLRSAEVAFVERGHAGGTSDPEGGTSDTEHTCRRRVSGKRTTTNRSSALLVFGKARSNELRGPLVTSRKLQGSKMI